VQNPFVQLLDEGAGRIRSAACLPLAWQPLAGVPSGGEHRALFELEGVALDGLSGSNVISWYTI